MLVVRVELWSARTGKCTEIARMDIANVGGTDERGDYRVRTIRGRDKVTLDENWKRSVFTRGGSVRNYPRQRLHVWHLVALALKSCGYGVRLKAAEKRGDGECA